MLKKISTGRVESDKGFSVQISGPETMIYEDQGRTVDIDWTYDPKLRKTIVYVNDVRFWEKPILQEISTDDKQSMIRNIVNAVQLLDGNYELA